MSRDTALKMKNYKGFIALRNAVNDFPLAGGIYTKPKVDVNTIMDAEYVVVPGMEVEEYVQEKGGYIPVKLAGQGYFEWLEAPIVQDIITNRLDRDAAAPIADIVEAVFYYHEYDTFKDD